ncbi:sulfate ABC transporter substrate-binding protein [Cyanobacterium sp. IPPAS B-1200]|uniref:sulfate ABC transporter substrate-binding protein n=1 Tax=Cyanobacterium sp. IPPAS B-1200 TaxID=1562720 RepID=UPI0008525251|nr:sulfate ABC transporter substrate-binding protein [Cyanobacterium sp. IPPAS B-1200]OEJ78598.1 sulfate-binding protein [Cyanobacterium sp. IPPAS B-1200]
MKLQRRLFGKFLVGLTISGVIASCASPNTTTENATGAEQSQQEVTLTLVSYAVTQSAYEKIVPQFVEYWEQETGQKVTIDQSYGGSGSQARAVIDGLEADIVALALSSDHYAIQEAGLIEPGWEDNVSGQNGIITRSVVALVGREGGETVENWQDLADPDISVITANPKTSGGARWNFLALWGSVVEAGGTVEQAKEFVGQVYSSVATLPRDAREASDVFYSRNQGDVLMNYENELLLAESQGRVQPYVIPTDYNISIEGPIAVVDEYVDRRGTREVAEAFVEFLYTVEAQRAFAEAGFRPVNQEVFAEFSDRFPVIENLFTIEDFGGWPQAQPDFFDDGAIFDQAISGR